MFKKFSLCVMFLFVLGISIQAQQSYTFNGGVFSYGTMDLTTGEFTTMNFLPQGSNYYPATADNNQEDGQYAIMADFGFPTSYYLWHIDFTAMTGDSIAPVSGLASGQGYVKGMAYNVMNDTWYVISGDDFGSASYLYTIDITTGALTQVGQIQNANLPTSIAIDCDGTAYIVNVEGSFSSVAVLYSLDLTTAVATAIGTDLGLAQVVGFSQDMDFNPADGNLYWSGYWSDGFFSEGGSFRLVDVTNGTSTEISSTGQFVTLTGFNVNGICPPPPPPTAESYTFNGGVFSYGTMDLTTGEFTTMNFLPQGSNYYPATADNNQEDGQYAIMADFGFPTSYYLWHIDFTAMTGDSIAPVSGLASGQGYVKGMAYNVMNDTWYVISGDDFGSASYLYTIDITTGALTQVGQIQNANLPTSIAIDCDGTAYIVNVEGSFSSVAVLYSLDLTTAVATAIGTDLGLAQVVGFSQDMDFNPADGNLYWSGYWSDGFFSEGGSFRLVDVTNGTSTEISSTGQFVTLTGFNVNGICPPPPPPTAESYTFNGGVFSYGTMDLTTGEFTTMNFLPQGSNYYPATADNNQEDGQYAIMADFGFPTSYYLWHIDFTAMTGDSIAPVSGLASGQGYVKGMAYNVMNDTWYVISGDDFGSASYLYTIDITTGALTQVGQIQNANLPTSIAIDCDGTAYIVNVEGSFSSVAVLYSLDLTTAVATAIGTDLGLAQVVGFSQDMDFNPADGNLYWSGYWSDGFFSEGGSFRLVDVTNGTSTEISSTGQFVTLTGFNVNGICAAAATFPLTVNVSDGWNMVSVPGTNPDGMLVNDWWSNLNGTVYKFVPGSGYSGITTTIPGEGYWMKNTGASTYNYPAIGTVAHDPIAATAGWNMIGGFEDVVDVNILTTNTGNIVYPIYQFNPGTGYAAATNLTPGSGYWVKVSADCEITIPDAMSKSSGDVVQYFKESWGQIILTDAAGRSYTLYATSGDVDLNNYELPPAPPAGTFDIRFSSGRIAEDLNTATQSISMNGIQYPVSVEVRNLNITLQDESGKELNAELKSGDKISIANESIHMLLLISGEVATPVAYKLEQNYPNPFNPSTKIIYSVPADGMVNISVYNILGEKVTDIVNTIQKAGNYEVTFDARNLASGTYIYRMESGNFVSVKKMLLLK